MIMRMPHEELNSYHPSLAVSQHEECTIAVHNMDSTSSGEHKVIPSL
jgi:hypothetical protein